MSRSFVRLVDDRLVLTTQLGGELASVTRRLTFLERLVWRIARRTPKP